MAQQIRVRPGLLSRLRKTTGIPSDEAQARMLGISRSTLHRLESGAQPSGAIMVAICATYGLGLGEAFEIVDSTPALAKAG